MRRIIATRHLAGLRRSLFVVHASAPASVVHTVGGDKFGQILQTVRRFVGTGTTSNSGSKVPFGDAEQTVRDPRVRSLGSKLSRTRAKQALATLATAIAAAAHEASAKHGVPSGRAAFDKVAGQLPAAFRASLASATATVQQCSVPTMWKKTTPDECASACDDLLHSVLHVPFSTRHVAGLYTIEVPCHGPHAQHAPTLVMTPGYGSGSGMWLFNLTELSRHYRILCVDWLGTGASHRPKWTHLHSVGEGERFFTESLEEWRKEVGTDKFVLLGHSLGGYLSAAYTLHHPGRVSHLVLVSPAGIPTAPDPDRLASSRNHWLIGLLASAWEAGVTPQSIIRAMGPLGEKWATNIVSARFRRMLEKLRVEGVPGVPPSQAPTFNEAAFLRYLYAITVAEGSGEFALRVLLQFGAHAKEAMGPRLLHAATVGEVAEVGEPGHMKQGTDAAPNRLDIPVTLMYGGGRDWMDDKAGLRLALALRSEAQVDASCMLVPDSGHHLYLENVQDFNSMLLSRLKGRDGRGRASATSE